jgi:hypothetical protein
MFRRAWDLATFIGVAVAVLGVSGCYNPHIANGGYLCNTDFVPECPSGFHCENNLCVNGPVVDAAGEMPTTPPVDAPMEKPAVDAGHDMGADLACFAPVATCTAAAGLTCDPVCQTGCKCHEKCAVVSGALACKAPFGTLGHVGDACVTATDGSDNCAPGLTCMVDGCGARCYAYCRADKDCPTSACNRDAGAAQKVCDVPYVSCHPIRDMTAGFGCPLTNDACYLSPTAVDVTMCDCPAGSGLPGASCKLPHDCVGMEVCIDPTGGNNPQCHQVCDVTSMTSSCIGGGACLPLNGSKKFGFCN